MSTRPPDLPDYDAPPVTEVALGVQFNGLDRLLAPYFGLMWEEFRPSFPGIEQHPPVDPAFETFPEKGPGATIGRMHLQLVGGAETPRIFFLNEKKNELFQVQRDRFLFNWRKFDDADVYPHFEKLLDTFRTQYRRFEAFAARHDLGSIAPTQCEVVYVNQIRVPPNETTVAAFERIFGQLRVTIDLEGLGKPEDARFMIRYVMRDAERKPVGRLHVSADPAMRPDGMNIVQLTLLARGRPPSADLSGIVEFLLQGRHHIVQSFDNLTSREMHAIWGRRQ